MHLPGGQGRVGEQTRERRGVRRRVEAQTQEGALAVQVRAQVLGGHVAVHVRVRDEQRRLQLDGARDVHRAGDLAVAKGGQVVGDDHSAQRPANQHGVAGVRRLDDRGEVLRPAAAVVVGRGVGGFAGEAVAAQVVGDQAEASQIGAAQLRVPTQVAAEQSVDEDDGGAVQVAGFLDGQRNTVGRGGRVGFRPGMGSVGRRAQGRDNGAGQRTQETKESKQVHGTQLRPSHQCEGQAEKKCYDSGPCTKTTVLPRC